MRILTSRGEIEKQTKWIDVYDEFTSCMFGDDFYCYTDKKFKDAIKQKLGVER